MASDRESGAARYIDVRRNRMVSRGLFSILLIAAGLAWTNVRGQAGESMRPNPAAEETMLTAAARAIMRWLPTSAISPEASDALCGWIAEQPDATAWSGRCGTCLIAVAVRPLASGDGHERIEPAIVAATSVTASQELVLSKAMLERFQTLGLTDALALVKAFRATNGRKQVSARIVGMEHQEAAVEGFAVAWVQAEENAVVAQFLQSENVESVRSVYLDSLHQRMQALMRKKAWRESLAIESHLSRLDLTTAGLLLDGAVCSRELEKRDDVLRKTQCLVDRFQDTASFVELARAGDIALALSNADPGDQHARTLALRALDLASQRLLYQVVQFP